MVVGWLTTAGALGWLIWGRLDPAGRLFAAVTVLVVAVCSVFVTRARPRLAATSVGIEVRGLAAPRRFGWGEVTEVRLLRTPGLARRSLTLEITVNPDEVDADEILLIFGRLDLCADPRDVADALETLRPGPG
jgi:hypothetical protein